MENEENRKIADGVIDDKTDGALVGESCESAELRDGSCDSGKAAFGVEAMPDVEAGSDTSEFGQRKEVAEESAGCSPATSSTNSVGKRKLAIAFAFAAALVIAIIAILISTHIICFHEHVSDATCTQPSVCQDCGRPQGDPLGHDYESATCENPKTCVRCGYTEGDKLDHVPGEWEENVDVVSGKRVSTQNCAECGAKLDSKTVPLDVLYSSGDFIFTPSEFAQRMDRAFKDIDSKVGGGYEAVLGDLDGDPACAVLDKAGNQVAGIVFLDDGSVLVHDESSKDISGFMCTRMRKGDAEDFAYVTIALLMAIDPSFDLDEAIDAGLEITSKAATADIYVANGVKYGMEADEKTVYAMIA